MILVLIPGIGKVRNGSRSWFGIGGFGIQPSEFMKLSIIIFISKYISIKKFNLFKILILIFLVFGLIMLQPDFGTGIIIVMISISLLYLCGVSMKLFFRLGFIGIIGIIILIIIVMFIEVIMI